MATTASGITLPSIPGILGIKQIPGWKEMQIFVLIYKYER